MMFEEEWTIRPIADYKGPLKSKFAVPRHSGLVEELVGSIHLRDAYSSPEALRGLAAYEYIWLIWGFSLHRKHTPNATVRPPRLGGNERVGVFASRSPFRPNGLGLSCVRFLAIEEGEAGPILSIAGADLVDGSPIYDIKPYIPAADARPRARAGFAEERAFPSLQVLLPEDPLLADAERREQVRALIALDPRPAYHRDPNRIYYFEFEDLRIGFRVKEACAEVLLIEVIPE